MVNCPLCGYAFDPNMAESLCRNCPISHNCPWVCCPSCGYSISPSLAEMGTGKSSITSLADMGKGESARIVDLDATLDAEHLKILASMALLPGVECTVESRFPTFLVRVGLRQIALDRSLAKGILVRREPRKAGTAPR
jgi:Fe2+ transport system protein FeoA